MLPSDLSAGELALAALDHELVDAEYRLAQCEKCTGDGEAVCASRYRQPIDPGLAIAWRAGRIVRDPCPRYAEHELRQRLLGFGVPDAFLGATLERFTLNDEYREQISIYVDEVFGSYEARGHGVHLVGNVGTGKTFLACALLRELYVRGKVRHPRFVETAMLMSHMRDSQEMPLAERRAFMHPLLRSDLLVLDDLGAERSSEWVREQLGILINERWANSRAMIVTSNLSLDYYEAMLGSRSLSRLVSMLPVVLDFDWSDQRKQQ